VEEVKCLTRLLPVWSAGIVYYIVLTNLGNYNVLQAMQTDRHIRRSGFEIPAGSFVVFNMLALTVWLLVYDALVVPALQRVTKREGGITQLQRIGTGIVMSIATMVLAAAVERHRRRVGDSTSCFVLVPQQMLAGLSEAFAVLFLGFAIASYTSGLMVSVVHRRTAGSDGQPDWLTQECQHGLAKGRRRRREVTAAERCAKGRGGAAADGGGRRRAERAVGHIKIEGSIWRASVELGLHSEPPYFGVSPAKEIWRPQF
jgi:peptide/histidine transporter 3/4